MLFVSPTAYLIVWGIQNGKVTDWK
jgi:hypothetical protein